MQKIKFNFGKVAFLMCNFIFLLSGICLVLLGCVLLNDSPRILLSHLVIEPGVISQPLLYYAALAFIVVGLIVCVVALLGCWASWNSNSNWLLGTYMFLLIILLLTETSFGAVASLCPQTIGVILDRDQMVTGLMNNYGIPGRSQYTAAVDLAQTLFECCGMQSGSDYDGSKWWKREQETMHDLRVPHSCCFLSNTNEKNSFLDPKPINSSLCQAKTNSRYQYGRHVKGCVDKLNSWFRDHITIFLIIGLALVVVQLAVLLCAILVCLRKRKHSVSTTSVESSLQRTSKSSKRQQRTVKNLTPKPERKNASAQIKGDNGCRIEQDHDDLELPTNFKGMKTLKSQDFGEDRGRDSPSSLPLVLRNDHFWKYDGSKNKSNTNSKRKNSQETVSYNQESNVYFTPYHSSSRRREEISAERSKTDTRNIMTVEAGGLGTLKDGSDDKSEKLFDNCFGLERVPSHQSEVFQNSNHSEPWNTVGIPTKDSIQPDNHQIKNQMVRRAVRNIESGLYNKEYQDRRKDIVEEKIDISKAKLYWQEREKKAVDQSSIAPNASADYFTDYPSDRERDENVIVLKLGHSDGLILKPEATILLTPIVPEKKSPRDVEEFSRKINPMENEKEDPPNYEKNWNYNCSKKDIWDSDIEGSVKYFKLGYYKKPDDTASKVLKFQSTEYPFEMQKISQIPRVTTKRLCKICTKTTEQKYCPRCRVDPTLTKSANPEKRKFASIDRSDEKKENSKDDMFWASLNSQRSRKNFFGNSGSYTLRCNLNPIKKINQNKKKFYLTPETLQLGYLKKLKEPKITYEKFTAKKREFVKEKPDFFNPFNGLSKGSDAVMW